MAKYEVERTTIRTYKMQVEANSEREAINSANSKGIGEWLFEGEDEEETSAFITEWEDDE